jgi:hypothetical protein
MTCRRRKIHTKISRKGCNSTKSDIATTKKPSPNVTAVGPAIHSLGDCGASPGEKQRSMIKSPEISYLRQLGRTAGRRPPKTIQNTR